MKRFMMISFVALYGICAQAFTSAPGLIIRNATYSNITVDFNTGEFLCKVSPVTIAPNGQANIQGATGCGAFYITYPNGKRVMVDRGYPRGMDYTVRMTTQAVFSVGPT